MADVAKAVAITFGVLLAVFLVVMIILLATGNLHFGKVNTTPTNAQIVTALQNGVTITSTDSDNNSYQVVIKTPQPAQAAPGITLNTVASMTAKGVPVPDIGGNTMEFTLAPAVGSTPPGATYVIIDTKSGKKITVPPTMSGTLALPLQTFTSGVTAPRR